MVNKKYVAVVALVIIVASAVFLIAQPTDHKCDVCGMSHCNMDHAANGFDNSNNSLAGIFALIFLVGINFVVMRNEANLTKFNIY